MASPVSVSRGGWRVQLADDADSDDIRDLYNLPRPSSGQQAPHTTDDASITESLDSGSTAYSFIANAKPRAVPSSTVSTSRGVPAAKPKAQLRPHRDTTAAKPVAAVGIAARQRQPAKVVGPGLPVVRPPAAILLSPDAVNFPPESDDRVTGTPGLRPLPRPAVWAADEANKRFARAGDDAATPKGHAATATAAGAGALTTESELESSMQGLQLFLLANDGEYGAGANDMRSPAALSDPGSDAHDAHGATAGTPQPRNNDVFSPSVNRVRLQSRPKSPVVVVSKPGSDVRSNDVMEAVDVVVPASGDDGFNGLRTLVMGSHQTQQMQQPQQAVPHEAVVAVSTLASPPVVDFSGPLRHITPHASTRRASLNSSSQRPRNGASLMHGTPASSGTINLAPVGTCVPWSCTVCVALADATFTRVLRASLHLLLLLDFPHQSS